MAADQPPPPDGGPGGGASEAPDGSSAPADRTAPPVERRLSRWACACGWTGVAGRVAVHPNTLELMCPACGAVDRLTR